MRLYTHTHTHTHTDILNNKKIILIIISIIILIVCTINSKELIKNILNQGKKETVELFSYIVYDNQNNEKIKTLITINSENGIEYIETPEGKRINANGKSKVSIDYISKKDEEKIFKVKEINKEEKEEKLAVTENTIKETINIEKIHDDEGYKTIEISSNKRLDGFKISYKIGENGTWVDGDGKISILDYDIRTKNLANSDETVTISAKIENANNGNIVITSEKYKVDMTSTTSEFVADSLLQAMEKYDFGTGTFTVKVGEEIYNLKVYSFNKDQELIANTTLGAEEDVATANRYAQNMIVYKVNGDLTINEGVTLTSYASKTGHGGPKGMMIYCTGTLTNNGTISMTARGAKAEGQNVYLWKNADGSYETVPAVGAAGGNELVTKGWVDGISGQNGIDRATGGGGTGGLISCESFIAKASKAGSGTSYSGGTGSGGTSNHLGTSGAGSDIGGSGGDGRLYERSGTHGTMAGGGAGNPTGTSYPLSTSTPYYAKYNADIVNGTGGLLILYSDNIKNNGNITANGIGLKNLVSNITGSWGNYNAPGGSSGGGSINIFYKTSCEYGNLNANGGASAVGHVKSRKWWNRFHFSRKHKYRNI